MKTITFEDFILSSGISDSDEISWSKEVHINPKMKPYEHQLTGLNLLCQYERAALYDQTGTGKSLPIQGYAAYRAGQGHKIIGLMPPVLLTQFYEGFFDSFVGIDKYLKVAILKGTKPQREKLLKSYDEEGYPDILLMTYDLFRGSGKGSGYDQSLKVKGYNIIIADEAQALRNTSSSIHKKVYRFIGGKNDDQGKFGLVLSTGTPSHTHLEQNYGLIRLVTPNAYGSKSAYERLHVVRNYGSPYKEIIAYDNYDVMILNLYLRARRVEKIDVAKDLPDKVHTVIPVDLHPKHKKLYKKLLDERVLTLEDEFIDAVQDQAMRQIALQIVSDPNKFSDIEIVNNLEKAMFELIDSIDMERTKLIIFVHFIGTSSRLQELLSKFNPAILNGSVSNKDPQVDKFLNDDSCRVLVAHPKSAGAGLNLQSVCSDILFYECPDSPGDLTQAEDRVHRLTGTNSTVNVYFLSPKGTWAAKKIKQVQKKDDIINRVVGDKSSLLGDLF